MKLNNRELIILYGLSEGINLKRIHYLAYIAQQAGINLGCQYTVGVRSLCSFGIKEAINSLWARGYIKEDDLTNIGEQIIESYPLTMEFCRIVDRLCKYFEYFDDNEDLYICIVDFVIQEVKKDGGLAELEVSRQKIYDTVTNIIKENNEEDFNTVIGFMLKVRNGGLFE